MLLSEHVLLRTLGDMIQSTHVLQRTLEDILSSLHVLLRTLGDMPQFEKRFYTFGIEFILFRKASYNLIFTIFIVF